MCLYTDDKRKGDSMMKIRMKKFASLIIVAAMLASLYIPAIAAEKTVVDLTDKTVITESGMVASSVYTRSGNYSAELSGRNLKRKFSFSTAKDWSSYNTLNVWVYSPAGIQTPITFVIKSENPKTPEKDYYYLTEDFGSMGWNRFSVVYNGDASEFDFSGSPLGLSDVTGFEILTNYGEYKAKEGTDDAYYRMFNYVGGHPCRRPKMKANGIYNNEIEQLINILEDEYVK